MEPSAGAHHHAVGFLDISNFVVYGSFLLIVVAFFALRTLVGLALKKNWIPEERLPDFLARLVGGSTLALVIFVSAVVLGRYFLPSVSGGHLAPVLYAGFGLLALGVFALFPASVLLWFADKARIPLVRFERSGKS